jgi:hypothetical protein
VLDIIGGHDRIEGIGEAGVAKRLVDEEARRVGGEPQPHLIHPPQAIDQLHRAGSRIHLPADALMHELDHLIDQGITPLEWPTQPLSEVAGGDSAVRPDHRHLVLVREIHAMAPKELHLGFMPEGLGIEQEAVHVEDDGPIPPGKGHRSAPRREEGSAALGQ